MTDAARPYRLFNLALLRRESLCPSLSRLTFTGPDVIRMATHAPDQRIKIFFPDPAGRPSALPDTPDWYAKYRALPPERRPAMRTYTIRHLRAEAREVDVDFVVHGDEGPASRWAIHARIGDRVQFTAPDAGYAGAGGGYEWKPPADTRRVLLIADETALPALSGILEELALRAARPTVEAFIEAPSAADIHDLPHWSKLSIAWLPRAGWREAQPPMVAAARRAWLPEPQRFGDAALPAVDVDAQILWDRAEADAGGFYAWVAGEAASVLAIRHYLVNERGLDRRALNLMGYWRRGRALDDAA